MAVFGTQNPNASSPVPPRQCFNHSMLNSARVVPKSWSATLSLPKSAFPPRALPTDRPKYLKRCTDDLYAWQRERRTGDIFTLHDGPPYANGSLHIGHALNKILKDILCRYKLSQGYKIDFVPGWDCHGLPIELKAIEKHAALDSRDSTDSLRAAKIREAARKLAANAVEEQRGSFRQWGIMADWSHAWRTMDKGYEIKQLGVFKELVKKGLIQRRLKPVYWSPSSRTALAEAELEYNDNHLSTAAFVKYAMKEIPAAARLTEEYELSAVIWTTTPWTLPANKAIGFNSEIEYAIISSEKHGFLLVAKSRLEEVSRLCDETFGLLSVVKGSMLAGATYIDHAFRREIRPFLHAAFVSEDSGSGLVHLAPGHGTDDYQLCLEHGISAFAPLDDEGRFTSLASPSNSKLLFGKEALGSGNQAVIDFLTSKDLLLCSHIFKHKYPYDWRSKQPLLVRATEQWFADVGEAKDAALKSLDAVNFIPEGGKERLRSFVKHRSEWCISRQRAWGVPIPAIYEKETSRAILTEASVSHIITTMKARGSDAWWTDDPSDPAWIPPYLQDGQCDDTYIRGKDTMDVWFDSGTSWTQLEDLKTHDVKPLANVYLEGSDQHRGWFQSSLLTHIAYQQAINPSAEPKAPFETLITHGFTLDEHSRKMSKSVGNVISPDQIMDGTLLPPLKRKSQKGKVTDLANSQLSYDAMGPDALRLWAASCDFANDVIVSRTVLKAINGALSKYRVTIKLLLGMLDDFNPEAAVPDLENVATVHRIALMQLGQAVGKALFHYERFDFNRVVQEINRYINTDLSSFYIESIKDTVYTDLPHGRSRLEAQSVLLQIYTKLLSIMYPITPLLVEEAVEYAPAPIKTVAFGVLREPVSADMANQWKHESLERDLPWLLKANNAVKTAQEQARAAKKMGSSLQSEVVFLVPKEKDNRKALMSLQLYCSSLETLLVVSKVIVCEGPLPLQVESAEWKYRTDVDLWGSNVAVYVYTPQRSKCVRCWKYNAEPRTGVEQALCERCEEVLGLLKETSPDLFESHPL